MNKLLHRFGKYYSKVIINNIGIFIFVGILSVVFGDCGWLPNRDIYAISQFVYKYVIPIMIAFEGGTQIVMTDKRLTDVRVRTGGAIAVMATIGMIVADENIGVLAAMILAPVCGNIWKYTINKFELKIKSGLEMLVRNLTAAIIGCIMTLLSFYLLEPVLSLFADTLMKMVNCLIDKKLIWLSSFIIEPGKVFFLNNSINHGILVPLGIQQAKETGRSILFLLEANPGPGLGILLALYFVEKEKREKYSSFMFAHFIGGLHEIYFPEVLANISLLPSLIMGGIAGNICFLTFNAAATGVVSPGSIITICLVCVPGKIIPVITGVIVSAAVSAISAVLILKLREKFSSGDRKTEAVSIPADSEVKNEDTHKTVDRKMINKIGFVCNAGVGSSAMGAALFRRKLKEEGIEGIEVAAYPADGIPDNIDLIICQKDLKNLMLSNVDDKKVYTVESLMNQIEYADIIDNMIKNVKNL